MQQWQHVSAGTSENHLTGFLSKKLKLIFTTDAPAIKAIPNVPSKIRLQRKKKNEINRIRGNENWLPPRSGWERNKNDGNRTTGTHLIGFSYFRNHFFFFNLDNYLGREFLFDNFFSLPSEFKSTSSVIFKNAKNRPRDVTQVIFHNACIQLSLNNIFIK